jgi:hypothetical protein
MTTQNPSRRELGRFRAAKQMDHQRNHGKEQQQVNQAARHMEHEKTAQPQDDQQNGDAQERSKPHCDSSEEMKARRSSYPCKRGAND